MSDTLNEFLAKRVMGWRTTTEREEIGEDGNPDIMNKRILCGLLQLFVAGLFVVSCLAFVGCSIEQPWSYAPCYLERAEPSSIVFYDCPDFRHNFTMEIAEDKPDGTRYYALFTSPFGDDRVPRVW